MVAFTDDTFTHVQLKTVFTPKDVLHIRVSGLHWFRVSGLITRLWWTKFFFCNISRTSTTSYSKWTILLNVKASAETNDQRLSTVIQKCWGTAFSNPDSLPRDVFIDKGWVITSRHSRCSVLCKTCRRSEIRKRSVSDQVSNFWNRAHLRWTNNINSIFEL